jgi:hypothetical protein
VGALRQKVLGIGLEEATFERRGFWSGDPATRRRLEYVGGAFVRGYGIALRRPDPEELPTRLGTIEADVRGFAFEGAAMALGLLDRLTPWRADRWETFLAGGGAPHRFMLHVGLGWALARLPWCRGRFEDAISGLDPLLKWLVLDGFGFHEGYFSPARSVRRYQVPRGLGAYACRAFDQGLGRSLWFLEGGNVLRLVRTMFRFPTERQADLWSGIGLACAYAGGADRQRIRDLRSFAGRDASALAQGAAFAAKARELAGNRAPHTELACEILCDASAAEAAHLTDVAARCLPPDDHEPAYEEWRRRIQQCFAARGVL